MICKDFIHSNFQVSATSYLYTREKTFHNKLEICLFNRDVSIWQYLQFTVNRVDSYCFGLFTMGFTLESWDMQHGDLADKEAKGVRRKYAAVAL